MGIDPLMIILMMVSCGHFLCKALITQKMGEEVAG
jgi:hypothetical protein